VYFNAAPIAVQNCEFFGIVNFTLYRSSVAAKTFLHSGRRDRFPIMTKSLIPEPMEDSIDAEQMLCNVIHINPSAMSSRVASLCCIAKK